MNRRVFTIASGLVFSAFFVTSDAKANDAAHRGFEVGAEHTTHFHSSTFDRERAFGGFNDRFEFTDAGERNFSFDERKDHFADGFDIPEGAGKSEFRAAGTDFHFANRENVFRVNTDFESREFRPEADAPAFHAAGNDFRFTNRENVFRVIEDFESREFRPEAAAPAFRADRLKVRAAGKNEFFTDDAAEKAFSENFNRASSIAAAFHAGFHEKGFEDRDIFVDFTPAFLREKESTAGMVLNFDKQDFTRSAEIRVDGREEFRGIGPRFASAFGRDALFHGGRSDFAPDRFGFSDFFQSVEQRHGRTVQFNQADEAKFQDHGQHFSFFQPSALSPVGGADIIRLDLRLRDTDNVANPALENSKKNRLRGELIRNIEWQWANNPVSVLESMNLWFSDKAAALARLKEGQKNNQAAIKTYDQASTEILDFWNLVFFSSSWAEDFSAIENSVNWQFANDRDSLDNSRKAWSEVPRNEARAYYFLLWGQRHDQETLRNYRACWHKDKTKVMSMVDQMWQK
jgi:hypothetical protein